MEPVMNPPVTHGVPDVDCEMHHTTLVVRDVREAVEFYTSRLGFRVAFMEEDPPTFAGINLGDVQIFLEQGSPNPEGCSVYFVVGDADELHEFHKAHGVEISDQPADRPYELRDYGVKDLHGYRLRFGHRLHGAGPKLRIERVDVPLRLEKRLAALLFDLARFKRMSLTSCVEEILLHTNEPYGDGVTSPHTSRQLAHIQELKRKHGIDYDSHASYRFAEE
jgi:catechol 2,3-dioxygenase-like lactoylglutathione lyase family enzyme